VPAVITPLPPLPASAMEMLESASRACTPAALHAPAVTIACTSQLLPASRYAK
jgi:hypothetical protein